MLTQQQQEIRGQMTRDCVVGGNDVEKGCGTVEGSHVQRDSVTAMMRGVVSRVCLAIRTYVFDRLMRAQREHWRGTRSCDHSSCTNK